MPSNFKSDLKEMLSLKKKQILVNFDYLTEQKLLDALNNGCKILNLKMDFIDTSSFVLEDPIIGKFQLVNLNDFMKN
jgi:hypothetical protein